MVSSASRILNPTLQERGLFGLGPEKLQKLTDDYLSEKILLNLLNRTIFSEKITELTVLPTAARKTDIEKGFYKKFELYLEQSSSGSLQDIFQQAIKIKKSIFEQYGLLDSFLNSLADQKNALENTLVYFSSEHLKKWIKASSEDQKKFISQNLWTEPEVFFSMQSERAWQLNANYKNLPINGKDSVAELLVLASACNDLEIVKKIVFDERKIIDQIEVNEGRISLGEAFYVACLYGHVDILKNLKCCQNFDLIENPFLEMALSSIVVQSQDRSEVLKIIVACSNFDQISLGRFKTILCSAVSSGNLTALDLLGVEKKSHKIGHHYLNLLLRSAVKKGHADIVEFLMQIKNFELSVNPSEVSVLGDYSLREAINTAAKNGYVDVIKVFKRYGYIDQLEAEDLKLVFYEAVKHGHVDVVELLKTCKNLNQIDDESLALAIYYAADNDHSDIIKELKTWSSFEHVKGEILQKILYDAAKKGFAKTVEVLGTCHNLNQIDPKEGLYSILVSVCIAAEEKHSDVIEVFKTWDNFNLIELENLQAIIDVAAEDGCVEIVQAFQKCKALDQADPNDGQLSLGNALLKAAAQGHAGVIEVFKTWGNFERLESKFLKVALYLAVQNNHVRAVETLLNCIDPKSIDQSHLTRDDQKFSLKALIKIADEEKYYEVQKVLKDCNCSCYKRLWHRLMQ